MKEITKTQWWLIYHQCIAFCHGFGISNGLEIPKEKTRIIKTDKKGNYRKNGTEELIVVEPQYMKERLDDYVKRLKVYKKSWNTKNYEDCPVQCRSDIEDYNTHSPDLIKTLKMTDLLQR